MFSSQFIDGFDMQEYVTTDENGNNENKTVHNKSKRMRKLKSIVLSPNVNDYDTGEDNLT